MGGAFTFTLSDHLAALPVVMLALFALAILMFDLWLSAEEKRMNAAVAMMGVLFATASVNNLQSWTHRNGVPAVVGFSGSMLIDRFAIYFFYLFLAAT